MRLSFGPALFLLTLTGLLTVGAQHGGPPVVVAAVVVALAVVGGFLVAVHIEARPIRPAHGAPG